MIKRCIFGQNYVVVQICQLLLVIQLGDELEDLRVVVLTNTSLSIVLALPGL
jgi:hypothetical protein